MTPIRRRLAHHDRAAAARRIQIGRLVEHLEQLQRCPARSPEQFELRKIAIAELLNQAGVGVG